MQEELEERRASDAPFRPGHRYVLSAGSYQLHDASTPLSPTFQLGTAPSGSVLRSRLQSEKRNDGRSHSAERSRDNPSRRSFVSDSLLLHALSCLNAGYRNLSHQRRTADHCHPQIHTLQLALNGPRLLVTHMLLHRSAMKRAMETSYHQNDPKRGGRFTFSLENEAYRLTARGVETAHYLRRPSPELMVTTSLRTKASRSLHPSLTISTPLRLAPSSSAQPIYSTSWSRPTRSHSPIVSSGNISSARMSATCLDPQ